MKRALSLALLLIAISWTSAGAQTGIRAPRGLNVGVMGGAAAYSDLQRGVVRVTRPTAAGVEERELGRRVGAKTSTSLAAYIAYWPSRNWGLRLQGSWSPTRFETLMKQSEAEFAGLAPSSEDSARLAGLSVMTGDLQVLFRLPTIRNRIMPYGIVGGGVTAYRVESGPEPVPAEAQGQFDEGSKIRPAGVFGVGAMLPMSNRAFRLHFELTDHLTSTPIRGGESIQAETPETTLEFDPQDQPPGETRVRVTNSVRFMVGLSFSPKR